MSEYKEIKGCMSLELAIQHCYKQHKEIERKECADEHLQLAYWLEELKAYRGKIENGTLVELKQAYWKDEHCTCSNCGESLSHIMDADSYFAIGFDGTDYCPWCGAKITNEARLKELRGRVK